MCSSPPGTVKCSECGLSFRSVAVGSKAAQALAPSYCDLCWTAWNRRDRTRCLEEELTPPVKYVGKALRDFGGQRVHVLQIGLGTFGTFLKPDVSWIRTLLEAPVADGHPPREEDLRGIGVDCLEESAGPHEQLAGARPACSVLKAAVGSSEGTQTLWCLPRGARMKVRQWMSKRNAPVEKRADADHELAYLENMSSIGDVAHPDISCKVGQVAEISEYDQPLLEKRIVECLTYEGVLSKHNASGCEILIIDAEGADCAIVKGMISLCTRGVSDWPTLVRYETRCESYDPYGSEEEELLVKLQDLGYLVLEVGGDSTLAYGPNIERSAALGAWADRNYGLTCYVCNKRVVPSDPKAFSEAVGKGSKQWRGTLRDQALMWWDTWCPWCCMDCYLTQATLGEAAA